MEITFPAMIRSVFDTLSLLAVNLKSILTIDCLGNFEFYDEWIIRVFVLPLAMVAIAALRFAYVRRTNPEAANDAAGSFRSNVFVVIFLCYRASHPQPAHLSSAEFLLRGAQPESATRRSRCSTAGSSMVASMCSGWITE